MRIQKTKIRSHGTDYDPGTLDRDLIEQKNSAAVYRVGASLQREEDGSVFVMGRCTDGEETRLGSLPDDFLRKNPMNVDRCGAEVEFADFSNGKMKNLRVRVVVNSDEMSGDIVTLDDDMLKDLGQDEELAQ